MISGPQQQRLDKALAGASDVAINNGSTEWLRCAELLGNVAEALKKAAMAEQTIGGQTGPAMAKAFRTSAEGMEGKSKELLRGSEALGVASTAIMAARVGQSEMNRYFPQQPDPGPYRPQPGPQDDADLTAASNHQSLLDSFTGSYESRENIARQWADRIDTDFAESTKTMQNIHGETFDPPGKDGDGPGTHVPPVTGPPGGRTRPPGSIGRPDRDPDGPRHPDRPDVPEPPVCVLPPPTELPPTEIPPTELPPTQPPPTQLPPTQIPPPTGLPPGPGSELPSAPGLDPAGATPVTTSGGVGPSLGAVAGGGLAGAALHGIRGMVSPGSVGGAPIRPIGSSGGGAAPGGLGRGGASSPGGVAGRGAPGSGTAGGGGGRGGAGGRGAGGRGAGGAGGGAGRRGAGKAAAGAGASAGRRGSKDQDRSGTDRDLFDDGQDWIDDADAAPGVID